MPNKHVYLAIGAAHGAALATYIYHHRRKWFTKYRWVRRLYRWDRDWVLYLPILMPLIGLWGLVPDLLHGTGVLSKAETRQPFFDLFFFHSTFEILEDMNHWVDGFLNMIGTLTLSSLAIFTMVFYVAFCKKVISECR